jgi:hypothetical protein
MKLLFLYFSGTGNTDYVAHYLARQMAHKLPPPAVEIELRSIEWQPVEEVTNFDLLAVGFPVYAGDSPEFVQAYLARLPSGEGRGAFVFCTKGAFAAGAVRRNLERLAAQGYVPLGGGSVLMPGTDGLSMVAKNSWMARKALEKDYDRLKDADRLAKEMASRLSDLLDGRPTLAFRRHLVRPDVGFSLPGNRELCPLQAPRRRAVQGMWPLRAALPCGRRRDVRWSSPLCRPLRSLHTLSPRLSSGSDPDRPAHSRQVSLERAERGF